MSIPDAIKAVETISSDLVALLGSDEYSKLAVSYFTEVERELKPACFVTSSSASQVGSLILPMHGVSSVTMLSATRSSWPMEES